MAKTVRCGHCKGTGSVNEGVSTHKIPCPACGGSGWQTVK